MQKQPGGSRIGAGRPWHSLTDHEYRVEMQRRRLRHYVRQLAALQESVARREQALNVSIQEAVEKLARLEEGADEVETEEAPALRAPVDTGVSFWLFFPALHCSKGFVPRGR